jgi:hypothetical protein
MVDPLLVGGGNVGLQQIGSRPKEGVRMTVDCRLKVRHIVLV